MEHIKDNVTQRSARSPWQVTKSVWWALFVRETLSRTMSDRLGWFWLFFQPILIIIVFVEIRVVLLGNVQTVSGGEFVPWIVFGLMGFNLYRDTVMRPMGAIEVNRQLFAYRQVKPIDPVLVRGYIEFVLHTFIFLIFIFASLLLDFSLVPRDPAFALFVWLTIWLGSLGGGLLISGLGVIFPEVKKIMPVLIMPMLLISGVIFPIQYLPPEYQHYLLYNPIVHALEFLRVAFFENYQPVKGISLSYLWYWCFSFITIGLMLHVRYEQRLKVL